MSGITIRTHADLSWRVVDQLRGIYKRLETAHEPSAHRVDVDSPEESSIRQGGRV